MKIRDVRPVQMALGLAASVACLLAAPRAAQSRPIAQSAPLDMSAIARVGEDSVDTATFAGGCFWCMVHPFDQLPGVIKVTSGYTGGTKVNPTYEEVSSGATGHAESVQVLYDPSKIDYDHLLNVYWHNIDPVTPNAQFCDHGNQYRSAIFYHGDQQRTVAEATKDTLTKSRRFTQPIVTQIVAATAQCSG